MEEKDGDTEYGYTENLAQEIFEQYEIFESEEDTGNHMTFYRHR